MEIEKYIHKWNTNIKMSIIYYLTLFIKHNHTKISTEFFIEIGMLIKYLYSLHATWRKCGKAFDRIQYLHYSLKKK